MLKKLSTLLLCLPLMGFGIIPISGRRDPAAGGGIEDDFSGTLSKWTTLSGSDASIASGKFRTDASGGSWIYTDEQTSTISQWAKVQYIDASSGFSENAGIYFRSTNNASEWAYCLRAETSGYLVWRECQGHSCTTISTATSVLIDDGDWFGLEVTGTSNQTQVKVWDWDGSEPADRASWGTADDTLSQNPSNPANTGKYVGLYDGGSLWDEFDNFSAGDI